MAPPVKLPGAKEGSVCSCQVKPYDPDDPTTWVRPKYVHIHEANAACTRPPIHTTFIAGPPNQTDEVRSEVERKDGRKKRPGSDIIVGRRDKQPPIVVNHQSTPSSTVQLKRRLIETIEPGSFYGSSTESMSNNNTATSHRPTLVNGKLVPSRLSAVETQISKSSTPTHQRGESDSFKDLDSRAGKNGDKDDNDMTDFMTDKRPSRTYSRADRRRFSRGSN